MAKIELISELTCPLCGHKSSETMPMDSCLHYYECLGCACLLNPLSGDCCVFCSYGSLPCPPVQQTLLDGASKKTTVESCCQ